MDEQLLRDVLAHIPDRPFHSAQFIDVLSERHPGFWAQQVEKYGMGGRGAGTHYSAYSAISHALHRHAAAGLIQKLDYDPAPSDLNWGHPMIRYWTDDRSNVDGQLYPDEVGEAERFLEGQVKPVTVNRYERNPVARKNCLEVHGARCAGCHVNFGERYGKRGRGFIHVHHKVPLNQIGEVYEVNPVEDLIPVCPNCHAIIHRREPMLTIEELREIISDS